MQHYIVTGHWSCHHSLSFSHKFLNKCKMLHCSPKHTTLFPRMFGNPTFLWVLSEVISFFLYWIYNPSISHVNYISMLIVNILNILLHIKTLQPYFPLSGDVGTQQCLAFLLKNSCNYLSDECLTNQQIVSTLQNTTFYIITHTHNSTVQL